jgi:hypothetical protein
MKSPTGGTYILTVWMLALLVGLILMWLFIPKG